MQNRKKIIDYCFEIMHTWLENPDMTLSEVLQELNRVKGVE